MTTETPQYNPDKRLPFGAKPPENAEFRAAVAKYDSEMNASNEARQKQAELRKAVIIPPEKAAAMRAQWENEINKARERIQKLH